MQDKRRAPRRQLRYTAWIALPNNKLHGCVVADISDVGARLEVEHAQKAPASFYLLLSSRGRPKRRCRVVWRSKTQVGVEFEKPFSVAEKNRALLKLAAEPPLPEREPIEQTEPAETA
jgi:hypothetical protein